ncbi:hypothetical protein C7B77_22065 [Chamaesiphon polymorphus CCALA 037]|uniref:Uncharacterized protein n=1 Tax=Chamaesiphon polymorphus CCALA 037 TaxID=2107692 RepID=A0A2T1G198_9CYAN|nr:hypothetical protein C7B77_22065 [Chamaesiphon polymorphus CCALA 037]
MGSGVVSWGLEIFDRIASALLGETHAVGVGVRVASAFAEEACRRHTKRDVSSDGSLSWKGAPLGLCPRPHFPFSAIPSAAESRSISTTLTQYPQAG